MPLNDSWIGYFNYHNRTYYFHFYHKYSIRAWFTFPILLFPTSFDIGHYCIKRHGGPSILCSHYCICVQCVAVWTYMTQHICETQKENIEAFFSLYVGSRESHSGHKALRMSFLGKLSSWCHAMAF